MYVVLTLEDMLHLCYKWLVGHDHKAVCRHNTLSYTKDDTLSYIKDGYY